MVRASVEAESIHGDYGRNLLVPDTPLVQTARSKGTSIPARKKQERLERAQEATLLDDEAPTEHTKDVARKKGPPSSSSEDPDVKRPKKKKNKKGSSKKKPPKDSDSSSGLDPPSDTSSSGDSSSTDSSEDEDAELCYEIAEFNSADLPDLPDKWDKGFRKLRSYVPLTLFNTALLESFHDDEADPKQKEKSAKSKSSLKTLERQLTYGEFIEMCDLEERYAREIYGLDTYADYVVKHKRIVSDLKKTFNCWMIGLRYHIKVRTVIFRRRKLIRSKVKGKTVLKDKVKIPNGLQPLVERQARHDADRAGDLQYVDNPYAPGGPKYGFSFSTGRPLVTTQSVVSAEKTAEEKQGPSANLRGRRGQYSNKPYVRRQFVNNYSAQRYKGQANYHVDQFPVQAVMPPAQPARQYYQYRGPRQNQAHAAPKVQSNETRAM